MAIELTDLSQVPQDIVDQNLAETSSRIQEQHPQVDLKRGVFHDLLLYYHAVLAGVPRVNINNYLSARSLQQIEENPSLADEEVTDHVLSNWRISRTQGETATGRITIVLNTNTSVTIADGAEFEADGLTFVTTQVWTAKPDEALVTGETDVLMTQLSDGNWGFTIDLIASEAGIGGNIAKDTLLLPEAPPDNYVTSYATDDFLGGTATETNDELLNKLAQGTSNKTVSNRVTMKGMLLDDPEYRRVEDSSIVGHGDSEMLRDQHSIMPFSYGGRVDWYIRVQQRLYRPQITKEARLISVNEGVGIWQFAVTRDDMPGFYEIRNIRLPAAENQLGGFEIYQDVRDYDLTGGDYTPDIVNYPEAAYSYYQTAIIQFSDPDTDYTSLSVGDSQEYEFEAVGMPLIGDLQADFNSRDLRAYQGDVLIKAPVPCFVQLNFTIHKQSIEADPDVDAIKEALTIAVNKSGFTGTLYASMLHDVVHGYIDNETMVGAIDMLGRIRRPDGATVYLRDDTVLQVNDDPANMVTSKTVQFLIEPEDIAISIETSVPVAT